MHRGTQQTRIDQYTAQSSGASLQKDPPSPLEKGTEPTGAQILAPLSQTQIVAISVDVNLLRADLRVVAERSVATEKQVMCLQSEMDTLKASVAILEAKMLPEAPLSAVFVVESAWDWLERNNVVGTPDSLVGENDRRPRGTAEVHTAVRKSTRSHRAGRGSRVIVRSDGTLGLERQREEREEAKLLVQTVTSETSSRSLSPCVAGRLSQEVGPEDT
ncbi:hypothetical protein NDU88_004399 [Pleurodeles waltl]|uniref:Uncharacterized protein n=1 Tax=Pleurodeles waltl TaxID=8319 RepID=A0AAV7PCN4_PLEWA|nr:hypothetical protein NDU88_004399 [Pleurodeles waltl]